MTPPADSDPAREFLSTTAEPVIVWTHAADVSRDGSRFSLPERGLSAYVGYVREVHEWGIVVGSVGLAWWWATRWDLIEWAGPRRAFP